MLREKTRTNLLDPEAQLVGDLLCELPDHASSRPRKATSASFTHSRQPSRIRRNQAPRLTSGARTAVQS
jgi:hypothetical protein